MIRVAIPQTNVAADLLGGLKAGESLVPDRYSSSDQKAQQMAAQTEMLQYKLAHPSVMYGGDSQSLMLAKESLQQGQKAQQLSQAAHIAAIHASHLHALATAGSAGSAGIPGAGGANNLQALGGGSPVGSVPGAGGVAAPAGAPSAGGIPTSGVSPTPGSSGVGGSANTLLQAGGLGHLLLQDIAQKNAIAQKKGDYFEARGKIAPFTMIPAAVRGPIIAALADTPAMDQIFGDETSSQRKEMSSSLFALGQWKMLTEKARTARIRAQGADQTFNLLRSQYGNLKSLGVQSGLKGQAQMTVGQVLNRVGKNSSIATAFNNIKQTQTALAKQLSAVFMLPNTDASAKLAKSLVNADITKMSWPSLDSALDNLGTLIGIERGVYAQTSPLGSLVGAGATGGTANLSHLTGLIPGAQRTPSDLAVIPPTINTKSQFKEWFKAQSPPMQAAIRAKYEGK